jgi:peptidoglycan hydrolase-like protein with peptidoglycan-binding domain
MPSTIRIGSRGEDVVLCQKSLSKHGISCTADGSFGPNTDKKVRSFQSSNGLTADGVVGPATWAALLSKPQSTREVSGVGLPPVLKHAQELGHEVWEDPYRLWLFGIRNPERSANSFDDDLGCAWINEDGLWTVEYWPGTTDPGTYWLMNPSKSAGCAILVEGQYLDTWKIDLHAGKYEALCQRAGEVSVYRDSSRDNKLDLDPSTIATGYFGINLHAATQREGGTSTSVDKWSAGCQVHASAAGFKRMMELAHMQVAKTGRKTFTYTLLKQW